MYYPRMISPTSRISLTRSRPGVVIIGGVAVLMMLLTTSARVLAAGPGEGGGEFGGATDSEKPKDQKYQLQAADPDNPKDPAVEAAKKKAALEAELAKKNKPVVEEGPPIYQKWQFWGIVVGVAALAVGAAFATRAILHGVNGGDVAPCPTGYVACYGEGR
jgi:hypothetical protein